MQSFKTLIKQNVTEIREENKQISYWCHIALF